MHSLQDLFGNPEEKVGRRNRQEELTPGELGWF